MTVQELIDQLMKVDDKSMPVKLLLDPKQDNELRRATYALDEIILSNFEKWNARQEKYSSTMVSGISVWNLQIVRSAI